jgi:hypothetical protein
MALSTSLFSILRIGCQVRFDFKKAVSQKLVSCPENAKYAGRRCGMKVVEQATSSWQLLAFPDERIEHSFRFKSQPLVELDGAHICLRHGQ